jgi:hypothetical protein
MLGIASLHIYCNYQALMFLYRSLFLNHLEYMYFGINTNHKIEDYIFLFN